MTSKNQERSLPITLTIHSLIYGDAWYFLRRAEEFSEQGSEVMATTYARMSIINIALAAEAFINTQMDRLQIEKGLEKKALNAISEVFENSENINSEELQSQNNSLRLLSAVDELYGNRESIEGEAHTLNRIRQKIIKRRLELAIKVYKERAKSLNELQFLSSLHNLDSQFQKVLLKNGSLRKRWLDGFEYLTGVRLQENDSIVKRFLDLIGPVRGKRVHERPIRGNEEAPPEEKFFSEVNVDKAREACETVQKMLIAIYNAAGKEPPRWVNDTEK